MQVMSLPFWLMIVSIATAVLPVWRSPMISSRWPRPIGTIESIDLRPVCTGWLTDWRAITPGATFSMTSSHLGVDRALAVDRLAERVDDAADQLGADRHFEDAAGALDRVAFGDVLVLAQDHRADRVALEVERQAEGVARGTRAFRPASRPDRPWMRTMPSVTDTTVPWLRDSAAAAKLWMRLLISSLILGIHCMDMLQSSAGLTLRGVGR